MVLTIAVGVRLPGGVRRSALCKLGFVAAAQGTILP